jgi:hypothetical protein
MGKPTLEEIRQGFCDYLIPLEVADRIEAIQKSLVDMWDAHPEAGGVPAIFRKASAASSQKQLKTLSRIAARLLRSFDNQLDSVQKRVYASRRLVEQVDGLYEPTVLALANTQFLARPAIRDIAARISQRGAEVTSEEKTLLTLFEKSVARAKISESTVSCRSGRPENKRVQVIAGLLYSAHILVCGCAPTITVNRWKDGYPSEGKFVDLVERTLTLLGCTASPAAVARAVIDSRRDQVLIKSI